MINIGLGQVRGKTLGGTQDELTGGNYCSSKNRDQFTGTGARGFKGHSAALKATRSSPRSMPNIVTVKHVFVRSDAWFFFLFENALL